MTNGNRSVSRIVLRNTKAQGWLTLLKTQRERRVKKERWAEKERHTLVDIWIPRVRQGTHRMAASKHEASALLMFVGLLQLQSNWPKRKNAKMLFSSSPSSHPLIIQKAKLSCVEMFLPKLQMESAKKDMKPNLIPDSCCTKDCPKVMPASVLRLLLNSYITTFPAKDQIPLPLQLRTIPLWVWSLTLLSSDCW